MTTPELTDSPWGDSRPAHWLYPQALSKLMLSVFGTKRTPLYRPVVGLEKDECFALSQGLEWWSCFTPVVEGNVFTPCGKCSQCKTLQSYSIHPPTIDISDCEITKKAKLAHELDMEIREAVYNPYRR